ncbi:MAG: 23S rRNA (uracil(1939)-C(5))-methyltransferase RlmD [Gemmiger sp.]|uniref:23S rRNA (uracil(1939)-C(5))-methyltransferase RlmD n=1 Tax=Gemmiger sp. TaxID=2049027 RepID=UPI002E76EA55|nr:23S rRNA (uracil(1939)-C(5))-methyltransferase RlmD [Gemmiger sp.]MEE0802044.1 23S rRNA (uracil(1939)-C(5))-methyltransferase RlmD [Gemmiger sp.]
MSEPKTCPLKARRCGGCPLLDKPYEEQLAEKQQTVTRLLGRFAAPAPILGQQNPWHYRNKAIASFAAGPRGRLTCGIYAENSHKVLPYADCLLQDEVINRTIAAVLEAARLCRWPAYQEDRETGLLRHVLVRRGRSTGQVLVVPVTAEERLPGSHNFVKALRRAAPWVTTVVQNCNPRHTSAVLGNDVRVLYGPGKITDTLCGLEFSLSPRSFYQVNPEQTEKLYTTALEFAQLTGRETVVDAYCGIGTIGLCAASRAAQVIGVERNPDAVRNAQANAQTNRITNARFVCADATAWMRAAAAPPAAGRLRPDVIFLDPPREGSTPACLAAVTALAPSRIVYVSCNPVTLARDLDLLARRGYRTDALQPVDMFPHTRHCEVVARLQRAEP